jgi:hypothetical protein
MFTQTYFHFEIFSENVQFLTFWGHPIQVSKGYLAATQLWKTFYIQRCILWGNLLKSSSILLQNIYWNFGASKKLPFLHIYFSDCSMYPKQDWKVCSVKNHEIQVASVSRLRKTALLKCWLSIIKCWFALLKCQFCNARMRLCGLHLLNVILH